MRLLSFIFDGVERLGCEFSDDSVIDFSDIADVMGDASTAPNNMLSLIESGDIGKKNIEALHSYATENPDKIQLIPQSDIEWLPPVPRPGKICGVALNNSASDERKISSPDHPMFFLKPTTSLVGHGQPIVARPQYMGFHPEPELGVIISKMAKEIDPAQGMDYVYGYTIIDDVTGNDMRAQDRVHYYALYPKADNPDEVEKREQHLSYTARYKGADGFGPMGPWLVTRDEVPDPHVLDVSCAVGGEIFTEDNTKNYTYRVEEVIAYISRYLTLEAGDVVSMGTAFRAGDNTGKPLHSANFARLDGPCEISISKLGTLSNPIVKETKDPGDWRLPR